MTNKDYLRRHVVAGFQRAATDPLLRPFKDGAERAKDNLRFFMAKARGSHPYFGDRMAAAYWAGVYSALAEQVRFAERGSR